MRCTKLEIVNILHILKAVPWKWCIYLRPHCICVQYRPLWSNHILNGCLIKCKLSIEPQTCWKNTRFFCHSLVLCCHSRIIPHCPGCSLKYMNYVKIFKWFSLLKMINLLATDLLYVQIFSFKDDQPVCNITSWLLLLRNICAYLGWQGLLHKGRN